MSVDASAVARVLGITTAFQDMRGSSVLFLPQRLAIVAQGATTSVYSSTKKQITSHVEAGKTYGWGSPIHLAAMQFFPDNGDGVGTIPVTVYPLTDGYESVPAAGDITPTITTITKASSFRARIAGVLSEAFVIDTDDDVAAIVAKAIAAINAVLPMPMVATDGTTKVNVAAKWAGPSGNGMTLEILGDMTLGVTFAFTQPTGGLVNPDVAPALAQIGNVWETMLLNGLDLADTDTLDTYQTFGEGRWGELVRKPLVVFTGNTSTTYSVPAGIADAYRGADRGVHITLSAPGSVNLPIVAAARELAKIARIANNNPPVDYGALRATGLIPGADGDQWDYPTRDAAVKAGVSTVEVVDGVITIGDVVTFYRPTGDPLPAYRYLVDIVKLQNIIFNVDLIFAAQEWAGAPLIPDDQPTVNPAARKPKQAKAEIGALLDDLGLQAIISDPSTAKKATTANIDSQNPKRLNVVVPVQLSGNTNVKSVDLRFGFFLGTAALAA